MKNIFSTETLKTVGAGVAGGATTLVAKKFVLSKVPSAMKAEDLIRSLITSSAS